MTATAPLLDIRALVKDYAALRPLRMRTLVVEPGRTLTLTGFDAPAAEMFVHLVTGAALPDQGDVTLFGTNTRSIDNSEAWLRALDGLGLVSHRAVLVDMFTVLQNVAMPLTLNIDPIAPDMRPQVEALAHEAGLAERVWDQPLGRADAETGLRVRLARAVAPNPVLIIAEHPSATLPAEAVPRVARDVVRIAQARGAALVSLSADDNWVRGVGGEVLTLNPGTGELTAGGWLERVRRVFTGG